MSTLTEHSCVGRYRAAAYHFPPSPPLAHAYLVSAPRPRQQLVLRFGWELITPWWSSAKRRGGFFFFLKGVNWGFSFWGYFISYGQIQLHPCDVWCVPCVARVPPAVISGLLDPGNNFRLTSLDLMNSPLACAYLSLTWLKWSDITILLRYLTFTWLFSSSCCYFVLLSNI